MLAVAAAAGPPPSRHPTCGEKAAPAKELHVSLYYHDICGYRHVQFQQHTINPVPQSNGMHPVCAVKAFTFCCLSGLLPFSSI